MTKLSTYLLRFFAAFFVAVFALPALVFILMYFEQLEPDVSDPDYAFYHAAFRALGDDRKQQNASKSERVIDVSRLNAGKWTRACILGGYSAPIETMQSFGAIIDERDQSRLPRALEESDLIIGYVDLDNRARFIVFDHKHGFDAQWIKECVEKPEVQLRLRE